MNLMYVNFCQGENTRYKIPKYIFFVKEFPMTGSGKNPEIQVGRFKSETVCRTRHRNHIKNGPESFFLKNRFRAGILSTNCLIYFFTIFTSNVLLSKLPLVSYASDFTSPTPLAYHSVTRSVVVFSTIFVRCR